MTTSTLGVFCAFARVIFAFDLLLIAPRRQDRKENFFDPSPWRALRLCSSPRGISFPQKRYRFIHGIISRGESRGIPTRPRSSCSPEALFHRASNCLSDSLACRGHMTDPSAQTGRVSPVVDVINFRGSNEASTGLRPWYPSFLRRNPPKHSPLLSELRRVLLAHSSMDLRPWSFAKADKNRNLP